MHVRFNISFGQEGGINAEEKILNWTIDQLNKDELRGYLDSHKV